MKNPLLSSQFSSRLLPAASAPLILAGLIAVSAGSALAATTPGGINNPFGTFFHTVDGQFSGGISGGAPVGEWSDVTPAAFISNPGTSAIPVPQGTPGANSLLFAGLGQTGAGSEISLFLMYDFLPRSPFAPVAPGELIASIVFPVTLPPFPQFGVTGGDNTLISVNVRGSQSRTLGGSAEGGIVVVPFFDIFVDLNLDGTDDVSASQLGIAGVADFGPSPLSTNPHLLVELLVPLRIPAGFGNQGGPLPGGGINPATGLYDPDPAFWGASASSDGAGGNNLIAPGGLQPASAVNLTLNPDGSTTVIPVPEPASAGLLLTGAALLGLRRRKS